MKKYQIIYADPPWSFRGYDLKKKARYVGNKYPVMAMEEIQNLPVGTITDANAILFLWVTMPKLNECFELIKSWGFEYKTIGFTWVKRNKKSDRWFSGCGKMDKGQCRSFV